VQEIFSDITQSLLGTGHYYAGKQLKSNDNNIKI